MDELERSKEVLLKVQDGLLDSGWRRTGHAPVAATKLEHQRFQVIGRVFDWT